MSNEEWFKVLNVSIKLHYGTPIKQRLKYTIAAVHTHLGVVSSRCFFSLASQGYGKAYKQEQVVGGNPD